jgi:SAM-dependent methyltransferase
MPDGTAAGEGGSDFVGRYDSAISHPLTRAEYGDSLYYNVGRWDGGATAQEAASRALVERHVALAALDRPGLRVLDVGCGLGQSTADIARARPDAELTGINISPAQVTAAAARFPALAFAVADAARLDVPDGWADRIVSVEAVFHFDTRIAFLERAGRALAPGGRIVYTDVLFRPDAAPWEWWVPAANRALTLGAYKDVLLAAGLSPVLVEDITAATWTPYCAHLRAMGRASADRIEGWVANYVMVVAEPRSSTTNGCGEASAAA